MFSLTFYFRACSKAYRERGNNPRRRSYLGAQVNRQVFPGESFDRLLARFSGGDHESGLQG